MSGNAKYISVLLKSKNVHEFLSNRRMYQMLLKQDKELIAFIGKEKQNLEGQKQSLEEERNHLVTIKEEVEDAKSKLEQARNEKAHLPPKQNGSSIMPGKINPVIPEVVSQVCYLVAGNDVTVAMCAEAGQLELNAFEPVLFKSIYESIEALTGAMNTLRINCVDGIVANEERAKALLDSSLGTLTALVPHIGYKPSAKVAKEALEEGTPVREIVLRDKLLTAEEYDEITKAEELTAPGIAAKHLLDEKK